MCALSVNKSLSRGTNFNEPGTATSLEIVFTQDLVNIISFYVCDKLLALISILIRFTCFSPVKKMRKILAFVS